MTELIGLSNLTLNLLFALFFLALLVSCLLIYFVLTGIRLDKANTAFEALLLAWLMWVSWFIGALKDNLFNGLILMPGADLRLFLVPAAVLGFYLAVRTRRLRFWLSALALLVVLPVFDPLSAGLLGLRLTASGAVLGLLGLLELSRRLTDFRENITGLSVKEALDRLPDGLLYAGKGYRPVSVNRRAREMLGSLGLSAYDRVDVLWNALSCHPNRVPETDSPDGLLIRAGEGFCYYIQKYPIAVGRRSFTQLYLRDVTEEFHVAAQIRDENRQLEENARELKRLLELAEKNAWRKEILNSRARLHDVLSQRLSLTRVLLGSLGKTPDVKRINEIKGLLRNIGQDLFYEPELSPQVRLEQLIQMYRTIGTDITCAGRLPEPNDIADTFVKIAREAFSNALRHAGASHILLRFREDESSCEMSVSNDGYCPAGPPKEGNGMQNMRARLEPFSGKMEVSAQREFCIHVSVPR